MFDFLDDPRQALSNVFSGLSEGDIGKAAPGLLGALLTGGLAATGVGIPLAVLLGSGLGGLSQGIASSIDPDRFKADSADIAGGKMADLLGLTEPSTGRDIASFLGTTLTDPLTYAGGLGGARLGASAGGALERAALARGPRYGTTVEDLLEQIGKMDTSGLPVRVRDSAGNFVHPLMNDLSRSPYAASLAAEVPPGSSILGAGAEGIAFGTPGGDVVRLGRANPGYMGRPDVADVLQPSRTLVTPGDGRRLMAERLPMASGVSSPAAGAATDQLAQSLASQALNFGDRMAQNVGFIGGRPQVIDPGALTNLGYAGGFSPMIQAGQQPGRATGALLSLLGSDQALQRALARGSGSLGYGQAGGILGALGGGTLPAILANQ